MRAPILIAKCLQEEFGIVSTPPENKFIHGPMAAVYARTALPIIFVMSMNGLLAVADAAFLGIYVGPEALGAVTLMFPMYMLVVALATLVASGMSSQLARHLGGERYDAARAVFAAAHGLALTVSAVLIVLFALVGQQLVLLTAAGSLELAAMGETYLRITVLSSPLVFVLSVNSDALRNEGRVGLMAAMSLLVALANIGFNYVLISVFEMGVAGSAYGTAMAQMLALSIISIFRLRGQTVLRPQLLLTHSWVVGWGRILALGAPQSLGFAGLALGSAAIVMALQMHGAGDYAVTISAYGITTRVITFVFLPLLGLSYAMQTITGNNFGAGDFRRADDSLKLALGISLIYCLLCQIILVLFAAPIAGVFVSAPEVIAAVVRITPMMTAMFFLVGPLMMLSSYFQAIGQAGRAAVLGLSKPYLFALPLTFLLPLGLGETGVWLAGPLAEILLGLLALIVLARTAQSQGLRLGLFSASRVQPV